MVSIILKSLFETGLMISFGVWSPFIEQLKTSLRLTFCVNWLIQQRIIHIQFLLGDFNLLRFQHEKSKGHFDSHWPFLFNDVIDSLDLREVSMVGRQFTWANCLPNPTYEKLDRVLMDTDWEDKYPLVSVRALEHTEKLSDHTPILLTTRNPRPPSKRPFKFELGWLQRDGFQDMVKTVLERPVSGNTPILRWNNKMRS
jgi:hypothetical protein